MQIPPVSVLSYGNYSTPVSARASGDQIAPSGPDRAEGPALPQEELATQPALSALASGGAPGTAVLEEGGGSGGVPVKMAAALYALNRSFDIPALALDLLV